MWKFRLGKKIGSGSFGDIYLGYHKDTAEEVAIKLEPANAQYPQLAWEYRIYSLLNMNNDFPMTYWFGIEGDFTGLVMEYLGYSIETLFNRCQRRFSLNTVIMLGLQMLLRIETLHSIGYIHRDIKPDNFLIGRGSKSKHLFCIDFGLAKKYIHEGKHIIYHEGLSLTGTARYASINNHRGVEQSRRDDLEAIMYVMIYLLQGRLPWQGLSATTKTERYRLIKHKKEKCLVSQLCRGCPTEFNQLVNYTRELHFDATPDYAYMRRILTQLRLNKYRHIHHQFDWEEME